MTRLKHKLRKHARTVGRHVRLVLFIWRAVIAILLSGVLVPLFLAHGHDNRFYLWTTIPSLVLYAIVTMVHLRLRRGVVKDWLESVATRLFLGCCALAAGFVFFGFEMPVLAHTMLVTGAVLYALFLARLSFLRVIGL